MSKHLKLEFLLNNLSHFDSLNNFKKILNKYRRYDIITVIQ